MHGARDVRRETRHRVSRRSAVCKIKRKSVKVPNACVFFFKLHLRLGYFEACTIGQFFLVYYNHANTSGESEKDGGDNSLRRVAFYTNTCAVEILRKGKRVSNERSR